MHFEKKMFKKHNHSGALEFKKKKKVTFGEWKIQSWMSPNKALRVRKPGLKAQDVPSLVVWPWGSATWCFHFCSRRKGIFPYMKCFHVSEAQVTCASGAPSASPGWIPSPDCWLLHWVRSSGWGPCPALFLSSVQSRYRMISVAGLIASSHTGPPGVHRPSPSPSKVGRWGCPGMGNSQNPLNSPRGAEQCPVAQSLGPSIFFFFWGTARASAWKGVVVKWGEGGVEGRGRGRGRMRILSRSPPSMEPDTGLDPTTMTWAQIQNCTLNELSHPSVPRHHQF